VLSIIKRINLYFQNHRFQGIKIIFISAFNKIRSTQVDQNGIVYGPFSDSKR
jgi:hypothetical protein